MPYFIKIGFIEGNISGYGQRGYHCFRRGNTLVRRWGAVEAHRSYKVHWRSKPQEKQQQFPNARAARAALDKRISLILNGGYSRLPAKKKILPRRRKIT